MTAVEAHPTQAYLNDRAHVFHSWSAQGTLNPVVVAGAEGAWFWDEGGKRYLDFASQLVNVNIGHQHPKLLAAIKAQADVLCTIGPSMGSEARSEAARLICEVAPGDLDMVFFTNGGAEATENAARMARLYTGRTKILSMYRSYHGATSAAIAMTGDPRRWASDAFASPGHVHFWGPYPYRSPFFSSDEAEEGTRALKHLEDTIAMEGPNTVAAIILEPVVGTNGILVPPPGYLQGVRELCDRFGIMLISDEVMAGFGRCGEWFAIDHWNVKPDLISFAKGVNSGYVPLGGVIISRPIANHFSERVYPGGLTYSGHPLACASAVASINLFKEEKVIEAARNLGENVIGPGLADLQARHPSIGEVRGLGAFWAIEFVKDRDTREPLVPFNAAGPAAKPMADLGAGMQRAGTLALRVAQPHPRGAAVQHPSGRGSSGPRHSRRGNRARRRPLHRLKWNAAGRVSVARVWQTPTPDPGVPTRSGQSSTAMFPL